MGNDKIIFISKKFILCDYFWFVLTRSSFGVPLISFLLWVKIHIFTFLFSQFRIMKCYLFFVQFLRLRITNALTLTWQFTSTIELMKGVINSQYDWDTIFKFLTEYLNDINLRKACHGKDFFLFFIIKDIKQSQQYINTFNNLYIFKISLEENS